MHRPDLYESVFLAMLFACALIRTLLDIRNTEIEYQIAELQKRGQSREKVADPGLRLSLMTLATVPTKSV